MRGLGHAGAEVDETPALLVGGDFVVPFWCEEDGAWGARYDLEGNQVSRPSLVLPGARRIALASSRERAVLFGSDGKGLLSLRVDGLGEPLADPVRHLGETRPPALLSAVRVRDESLCVAVFPGEGSWLTLSVGAADSALVRHRHAAPIHDLRARSVGSRAVVLLSTPSKVELAVVSGSGRVIQRPHEVFPRGMTGLQWPDAVWADDRWVVLAQAADAEVIHAQPLAKKGGSKAAGARPMFSLPKCAGPFAAAYHSQTYYALEVDALVDHAEMRLWRCSKTGDQQHQRVNDVVHAGAGVRRRQREVRSALGALALRMGEARGYRGTSARPALARDGASLELLDERGRLNVSVHPETESEDLALRVASALGDDPVLEEAPSSLIRLATWIRRRLSSAAREAEALRMAWAAGLAAEIDARVARVDHSGNTLVLELLVEALPSSDTFQRWIERVRDAQASPSGEEPAEPSDASA